MEAGVHELFHGVGNVAGGKGSSIVEAHVVTEDEADGGSGMVDGPGGGELGQEFLRVAIEAEQHAAGKIANGLGRIVVDQQGVEGFGLGADAEAQLVSALGIGRPGSSQ